MLFASHGISQARWGVWDKVSRTRTQFIRLVDG